MVLHVTSVRQLAKAAMLPMEITIGTTMTFYTLTKKLGIGCTSTTRHFHMETEKATLQVVD